MQRNEGLQLRVVYPARPISNTDVLTRSISPLLEICLAQTTSEGAYIYQIDREALVLELSVWRGSQPTNIHTYQVQLDRHASRWYLDATTNVVVDRAAWQDWRFQNLPEFLHNRFEAAVSVPVLAEGRVSGVANFCRREPDSFGTKEIAFLSGLSLPLGSLLTGLAFQFEKRMMESELERLNQKLADRKLFDRAKGILQARFGWTEEESYYRLRRTSRQSRIPMRDIARHVIEKSALPSPFGEAEFHD
jgi:signal transduction protein with GAF and PtsI domain